MNASNLSDYQLYQLMRSKKLDPAIRQVATDEFQKRNLTSEQLQLLEASYTFQFPDESNDSLKPSYRLRLVAFPFFTEIHSLTAGRMLAK